MNAQNQSSNTLPICFFFFFHFLYIFHWQIDAEIKKILTESYERAKSILKNHAKEHKALAEALLKYETLDADDIKAILTGDIPNWKNNEFH